MPETYELTRRGLFGLGGAAALNAAAAAPELREAVAKLEYLTPLERAHILDKGKAGVGKLPPEKLREIGQAPETWSLEITAENGSSIQQPLTLNWSGLMKLAAKRTVRFLHVCNCTNGADPFHMDVWEGVPFADVLWLAGPKADIRRVYYQSYHAPGLPPFQASMALGHILETAPGQLPPILAYRMNGRDIPASHGGPVRVVVPGTYGSKSIKWVRRVVFTNDYKANDSDAELNNDTESPMKTRARFIHAPKQVPAHEPFALTGLAQIGISGLAKVQYCVAPEKWMDAAILPPPVNWGGGLPGGKLPATLQTDANGTPLKWPLPFTIAHWAALAPGLPPGTYELCCRTIDGNGVAQPMPRPLLRTGYNLIHRVTLVVS